MNRYFGVTNDLMKRFPRILKNSLFFDVGKPFNLFSKKVAKLKLRWLTDVWSRETVEPFPTTTNFQEPSLLRTPLSGDKSGITFRAQGS